MISLGYISTSLSQNKNHLRIVVGSIVQRADSMVNGGQTLSVCEVQVNRACFLHSMVFFYQYKY